MKNYKKQGVIETSYIYFFTRWGENSIKTKYEGIKALLEQGFSLDYARKQVHDYTAFKIGETSNLYNRKSGIKNVDKFLPVAVFQFEGTSAERKLLEGHIRFYYEVRFGKNCVNYGNDHFICNNSNILKCAIKEFQTACDFAMKQMEKERQEILSLKNI